MYNGNPPRMERFVAQTKQILELETRIHELAAYIGNETLNLPVDIVEEITVQLQMLRMQIVQVAFRPSWAPEH